MVRSYYDSELKKACDACDAKMKKSNFLLLLFGWAFIAGFFLFISTLLIYDLSSSKLVISFVVGIAILDIILFVAAVLSEKMFYAAKAEYHDKLASLKLLLDKDNEARASGCLITPNDMQKYIDAKLDLKLRNTIFFIIVMIFVNLYIIKTAGSMFFFTPETWKSKESARPIMMSTLLSELEPPVAGKKYNYNLYQYSNTEIRDIFYDEKYASMEMDFTYLKAVRGTDYDAYYLYTAEHDKKQWLIVRYAEERVIFIVESGDTLLLGKEADYVASKN